MVSSPQHHPLTCGRILWLARRELERGFSASWHARVVAPRILSSCRKDLAAARTADEAPTVHVLCGEDQWLMTAWMLASWLHVTRRDWNVHIHDDGTLSQNAKGQLIRLFPGLAVIDRAAADETMGRVLKPFPLCAAYRASHPLGIKCFDVPHIAAARGDRYILLDSDVLFFSQPPMILDWAADEITTSSWFNEDPQEPSPISPEVCEEDFGIALWPRGEQRALPAAPECDRLRQLREMAGPSRSAERKSLAN